MLGTFLGLHWDGNINLGDAVVGAGTLLLAAFTCMLAKSTSLSVGAGEISAAAAQASAEASEKAVAAALESIEVDRAGVAAMRAQVEAIGAPYVILVPPDIGLQRSHMPLGQVDGVKSLRFKLWNLGSGSAVVRDVEITDKESGAARVKPLERYRPLAAGDVSEEVTLASIDWPEETPHTDVNFKLRYAGTNGTMYVTAGGGIAMAAGFESHRYTREHEGEESTGYRPR